MSWLPLRRALSRRCAYGRCHAAGQAFRSFLVWLLASGAEVEIVSNPGDGVWLFGRYLGGEAAEEEMIFAQDVVEVRA